ncbi:MAG: SagB/ThcOx family dehydrogenase [Spirochaetota bacterium]
MESDTIHLLQPSYTGNVSVETALKKRRSVRSFSKDVISFQELSQILWAANGISEKGYRTAPSAGATYPLNIYVATGNVSQVNYGLYRYDVIYHALRRVAPYDLRSALCRAALYQKFIEVAAADIIITAVYERTTGRYGQRGLRYVHMEAGHVGQNIGLQAVTLGLGTVMVGAFDDAMVKGIMMLQKNEEPLYIIPVGKPL